MLYNKLSPLKINKGTVINQNEQVQNFVRTTTVKYKTPELENSKKFINYGSEKVMRINEAKSLKDDKSGIPNPTLKKIVIPQENKSVPKKNKESIMYQNYDG